nr:RNA-directed DNA polymerase, eukaryota [Tanacetum cinerariifolium]
PSVSRPQKPGRYSSVVSAAVASTPAPPTPEKEATAKSAKYVYF